MAVKTVGSMASDANMFDDTNPADVGAAAPGTAIIAARRDHVHAIPSKGVTVAMLADGTDGQLITWDSDGNPAVVPTGTATHVLTSNGAGAAPTFQAVPAGGGGTVDKGLCNGRLTLESGVAISVTAQTDKTTLYFTPFRGNQIGLYDGASAWAVFTFAELSLDISGFTASKPYDIWAYDNAGSVALDSTVWTNGTTRATALALQDGVLCKSGATTRRYVGTIYMDAASKCQDTLTKRYVWNYYNRLPRPMQRFDPTSSWSYGTATVRQVRADAANQLEIITGVAEDVFDLNTLASVLTDAGTYGWSGIGEDSTTTLLATSSSQGGGGATSGWFVFPAFLKKVPAIGYHYYAWLERGNGSGTQTWYGASTTSKSGMQATLFC
jgi:hypothetical protein